MTTVRALSHRLWFRSLVAALLIAGMIALFVRRGPDWNAVYHAFDFVVWRWIVLAVLINLLSVVARSIAWDLVVRQALPQPHPSRRLVFSAFCVGLLANAALPARAGEIARVAVLRRRLPPGVRAAAVLLRTGLVDRLLR